MCVQSGIYYCLAIYMIGIINVLFVNDFIFFVGNVFKMIVKKFYIVLIKELKLHICFVLYVSVLYGL